MAKKTVTVPTTEACTAEAPCAAQVVWDDTEMATLFSNVVNASSAMEEFMQFFGTNET